MERPELPQSSVSRQQLEDYWREKLEEKASRYKGATARYRAMLDGPGGLSPSGPNNPFVLTLARQEQTQALAEYTHALKIFTDLTVHGILPNEQSATSSDGA